MAGHEVSVLVGDMRFPVSNVTATNDTVTITVARNSGSTVHPPESTRLALERVEALLKQLAERI